MKDTVLLLLPVLLLFGTHFVGGLGFSRRRPVCNRWSGLTGIIGFSIGVLPTRGM